MLAEAERDPAVRAIVVTGAGRAFCVGADSRALEGHVAKGRYGSGTAGDIATPGYGVRPEFDTDFAYHFGLTKPVIAALNGPAAGIGLVLACYADLRFAATGIKLTAAHGKLNLPVEYGLSWLLPRMIGLTRASDLLLTSRVVLAEEALAMGLVNAVVSPEELLPYTYNYVRTMISTVSPGALRESKRQIYHHGWRGLRVRGRLRQWGAYHRSDVPLVLPRSAEYRRRLSRFAILVQSRAYVRGQACRFIN